MDQHVQPRITVIIPNFNHGAYLERAICSVLDQGYDNLQLAVVDGGSCDQSIDVIQRYEDELDWWISSPDSGPGEAINRGIKHATGELIGVLCADDVLMPFALRRVAERYVAAGEPDWIVSPTTTIDARDAVIEHAPDSTPSGRLAEALMQGQSDGATMSFRRAEVYRRFGVYDPGLLHAFEYEYTCRLLAGHLEPIVMDAALAGRRRHAMSLSGRDPVGCRREHRRITLQYTPAALPASIGGRRRHPASLRRPDTRKAA